MCLLKKFDISSAELEANVFRFEVAFPDLSLTMKFTSNLVDFFLFPPIPSLSIRKPFEISLLEGGSEIERDCLDFLSLYTIIHPQETKGLLLSVFFDVFLCAGTIRMVLFSSRGDILVISSSLAFLTGAFCIHASHIKIDGSRAVNFKWLFIFH